jgi:hypothetical protein
MTRTQLEELANDCKLTYEIIRADPSAATRHSMSVALDLERAEAAIRELLEQKPVSKVTSKSVSEPSGFTTYTIDPPAWDVPVGTLLFAAPVPAVESMAVITFRGTRTGTGIMRGVPMIAFDVNGGGEQTVNISGGTLTIKKT